MKHVWSGLLIAGMIGALWAQEGDNTLFGYVATDDTADPLQSYLTLVDTVIDTTVTPPDTTLSFSYYNQYARDMVIGDLTGNGLPDIVLTDYENGGRFHVFEVVGDNTLQHLYTYPGNGYTVYTSTARSVAIGDLDGDGNMEVLLAMTGGTGDVDPTHVGLHVFEWDPANQTLNLVAQITDFAPTINRFRAEDIRVGDFDNDGTQEVAWVNNGATSEDNLYIFSISGTFESGFFTTVVETVVNRADIGAGGSTASAFVCDMDGDGTVEVGVSIWNNIGFALFEATGPDQYAFKGILQAIDAEDRYPFAKAIDCADVDGDGRDELFIGALLRSRFHVIQQDTGDVDAAVMTVATVNLPQLDSVTSVSLLGLRIGDQDHGTASDNPDLYITSDGYGVLDYEITNPANLGDSTVYMRYDIWNLMARNGVPDHWAVGINVRPTNDLDGDGKKELVVNFWIPSPFTGYPLGTTFDSSVTRGFLRIFEWNSPSTAVDEWRIVPRNKARTFRVATAAIPGGVKLTFALQQPSRVDIRAYNPMGREVARVYEGTLNAGAHTVTWRTHLPAGMYLLRVRAGDQQATRKVILR